MGAASLVRMTPKLLGFLYYTPALTIHKTGFELEVEMICVALVLLEKALELSDTTGKC